MNLISRNNARKDSDIQKGHAQNTNRKHGHAVGTDVNDYEAKLLEDSHKDLHASETEIKEYTKSLREPRPKYSEPSFGKLRTREFTSFGGDEKYGQDLYADDLDQRSKLLKALSSQVEAPAKEDFSNEARKFRDSLYELGLENLDSTSFIKLNSGIDQRASAHNKFDDEQMDLINKATATLIDSNSLSSLVEGYQDTQQIVATGVEKSLTNKSAKKKDLSRVKEIIIKIRQQIKDLFDKDLISEMQLQIEVLSELLSQNVIGSIARDINFNNVDLSKSKGKVKQKNDAFISNISRKIKITAEKLITISQDNSIYKEDASPQQIKTLQTKVSAFAEALLEVTPKSFEEYQSSN